MSIHIPRVTKLQQNLANTPHQKPTPEQRKKVLALYRQCLVIGQYPFFLFPPSPSSSLQFFLLPPPFPISHIAKYRYLTYFHLRRTWEGPPADQPFIIDETKRLFRMNKQLDDKEEVDRRIFECESRIELVFLFFSPCSPSYLPLLLCLCYS